MNKKLFRSTRDAYLAGVCGGIAEYLGIPSSLVRIAWAVLTLASGVWAGVILYVAAAILLPRKEDV